MRTAWNDPPSDLLLIEYSSKGKHFESDPAIERDLPGFIDDAHPAAADFLDQDEVAQLLLRRRSLFLDRRLAAPVGGHLVGRAIEEVETAQGSLQGLFEVRMSDQELIDVWRKIVLSVG